MQPMGRVPNRAAVGWKSPNNSISSNSSNSTSEDGFSNSLPKTRSVKPPTPTNKNIIYANGIPAYSSFTIQPIVKSKQISQNFENSKSTQLNSENSTLNTNCKKSPMLRRMKMALVEAENKQLNVQFQTRNEATNQTMFKPNPQEANQNASYNKQNSTNYISTNQDLNNQNNWQNSTIKGTVKANEDFDFQGFPKPPQQFFPPPPASAINSSFANESQKTDFSELPNHHPIEIKRIPLVLKGQNRSPTSPDYKDEKTCVLDELKQKQESGLGTGPIYKKNRSPMLRRMKLALAHIENESDL